MATRKRTAFRRWLYWQQAGLCYLQITKACQGRAGQMHVDVAHWGAKSKGAFGTFEHVIAVSKKARHETTLILLACRHCNSKKSDADPLPEHIEMAKKMRAAWSLDALPVRFPRRKKYVHQALLEAEHAKRRAALGLDALGTSRERERAIKALRNQTNASLGR